MATASCLYIDCMSKKPKLKAASSGQETLGQRLSRIRKERGFTQQQLADRTGLIQVLISDYEHGKLRLSAETAVRFADVLGITTDELLRGKKSTATTRRQPSLKLLRRMEQIENLPPYRQRALLTTIDGFLAATAQDR
jgi:transcriptional regulator with XRE-family HTH domain